MLIPFILEKAVGLHDDREAGGIAARGDIVTPGHRDRPEESESEP